MCSFSSVAMDNDSRVAFYYGKVGLFDQLHAFSTVIVHPQNPWPVKKYNTPSSQLFAYVSLGELDPDSPFEKEIKTSWYLGKNAAWQSRIMDLSNPEWRNFLLNKWFPSLWEAGYRGFFLDTLDSYTLLHLSQEKNAAQRAGLVAIIQGIKEKYPEAQLIANRGFEILPEVHQFINAIAAESLYRGWNNEKKSYTVITESDRAWLLQELNQAHNLYGLPVIVIDYVPLIKRNLARKTAKKIRNLGFIPWVTDPYLETLGVGLVEVIPRKILLLYNQSSNVTPQSGIPPLFNYLAFPLEFLGFNPVLGQVGGDLPEKMLSDRYAAIITWFDTPVIKNFSLLEKYLEKAINNHIPVVFMQNFGVPNHSPLLKRLQIKIADTKPNTKKVRLVTKASGLEYEIPLNINPVEFYPVHCSQCEVWLKLASHNQQEDAIAITAWGGYVLAPYDITVLPNGGSRWFINPFLFLTKALRLPSIPIPDVTSMNGLRILLTYIDGDGFISRIPWKADEYAGELIYEGILKKYDIPITVSLIQREFEMLQPNQHLEKRLMQVAKAIYALPWVKLATHTYSHPLKWELLVEGQQNTSILAYPDKNYFFNYTKEIGESAAFINNNLAPENKKVEAVFWSGDAELNSEKPLQIAAEAGLLNINGKAEPITNLSHSITAIAPLGMRKGQHLQIYAPIANEFQYTDLWSRPLFTFENVIHTFNHLETPVRFKPISIYYHFYSATEQAAWRALKHVYRWALKQSTIPLFVTEYIRKVIDFNHLTISRTLDEKWLISNNQSLKEFRIPEEMGFPDLDRSAEVLGFNTVNKAVYIHLNNQDNTLLAFKNTAPTRPYLIEANTPVIQWRNNDKQTIQFELQGYAFLRFKLANMDNCQLFYNNQLTAKQDDGSYFLKGIKHGTFKIQCLKEI